MTKIEITEGAVPDRLLPHSLENGAELRFLGVVRESEEGRRLEGIRYTAYDAMSRALLEEIAEEGSTRFSSHHLAIVHRIGFVPAGEPSILIEVSFPHSGESFDACHWYLREIKTRVPIWKEPIFRTDSASS